MGDAIFLQFYRVWGLCLPKPFLQMLFCFSLFFFLFFFFFLVLLVLLPLLPFSSLAIFNLLSSPSSFSHFPFSVSIYFSSFVCCFLVSSFEFHYYQISSSNLPLFNLYFSCFRFFFLLFCLSLFLVFVVFEYHFFSQVRGCNKTFFKNLFVFLVYLFGIFQAYFSEIQVL